MVRVGLVIKLLVFGCFGLLPLYLSLGYGLREPGTVSQRHLIFWGMPEAWLTTWDSKSAEDIPDGGLLRGVTEATQWEGRRTGTDEMQPAPRFTPTPPDPRYVTPGPWSKGSAAPSGRLPSAGSERPWMTGKGATSMEARTAAYREFPFTRPGGGGETEQQMTIYVRFDDGAIIVVEESREYLHYGSKRYDVGTRHRRAAGVSEADWIRQAVQGAIQTWIQLGSMAEPDGVSVSITTAGGQVVTVGDDGSFIRSATGTVLSRHQGVPVVIGNPRDAWATNVIIGGWAEAAVRRLAELSKSLR